MGQGLNQPRLALELVAEDLLDLDELALIVELSLEEVALLVLIPHQFAHFSHQVRLVVVQHSDRSQIVLRAVQSAGECDGTSDRFNHVSELLVVEGTFLSLASVIGLFGVLSDLCLDFFDHCFNVLLEIVFRTAMAV